MEPQVNKSTDRIDTREASTTPTASVLPPHSSNEQHNSPTIPNDNSKQSRATQISTICSKIDQELAVTSQEFADLLKLAPINEKELTNSSPREVLEVLKDELNSEKKLEELIGRFERASQLYSQCISSAKADYLSSTGILDDQPKLSLAVCLGLSALSLGAAIYIAVATHGTVHHAWNHAVEYLFGHGSVSSILATTTYPIVLFLEGIPVLGASVLGPMAFGFLKSLGGLVARNNTEIHSNFEKERKTSEAIKETLEKSILQSAAALNAIKPELLNFFRRNERLRMVASTALMSSTTSASEQQNLETSATELGSNEIVTILKTFNLIRKFEKLADTEFRSYELQQPAHSQKSLGSQSLLSIIKRSWDATVGTFRSVLKNTSKIGTELSLESADTANQTFEKLPKNLLSDPVSALGSGLTATLHIALETGAKPEKALLDAIKGFAGLARSTIAGGPPEGPSAETILRVLFELDELEKGSRTRWFIKLIPSMAMAALKKPAIILKAQRKDEASGSVTPTMYKAEMQEHLGRGYSFWSSLKEIAALSAITVREGSLRLLVETPLTKLSQRSFKSSWLRNLPGYARQGLIALEEYKEDKLNKKLKKYVDRLSDGKVIDALTDPELEIYVVQKFLRYRHDRSSNISQKDMLDTLSYWSIRRNLTWHIDKEREQKHLATLREYSPQHVKLFSTVRSVPGIIQSLKVYLNKKTRSNAEEILENIQAYKLKKLVDQLNSTEIKTKPSVIELIDRAPNGDMICMDTSGKIVQTEKSTIRALFNQNNPSEIFSILPYADSARIAAAELALAIRLEPFQRAALLRTHYALMSGQIDQQAALEFLLEHNFSKEQLLGNEDKTNTPGFARGLFGLGILKEQNENLKLAA